MNEPSTFPIQGDFQRLRSLSADELAIVETIIARIDVGRRSYGAWRVNDGRNNPGEALAEVMDALAYVAAELVRQSRVAGMPRAFGRRVYVCHPLRDDPEGNIDRVCKIAKAIIDDGDTPIAPQLYLPTLVDVQTEPAAARGLRHSLVEACDEVRVYGPRLTDGMRSEIQYAKAIGIPVAFMTCEPAVAQNA